MTIEKISNHYSQKRKNEVIEVPLRLPQHLSFQPGFRGTQWFRSFFTGFRENPKMNSIMGIQVPSMS